MFTREDGKPVRDFRGSWAKACDAAKVPGLLFHDLRRTAARNLRRAGVAEGVIMKIGGWKTRSVFERYEDRFAIRHSRRDGETGGRAAAGQRRSGSQNAEISRRTIWSEFGQNLPQKG